MSQKWRDEMKALDGFGVKQQGQWHRHPNREPTSHFGPAHRRCTSSLDVCNGYLTLPWCPASGLLHDGLPWQGTSDYERQCQLWTVAFVALLLLGILLGRTQQVRCWAALPRQMLSQPACCVAHRRKSGAPINKRYPVCVQWFPHVARKHRQTAGSCWHLFADLHHALHGPFGDHGKPQPTLRILAWALVGVYFVSKFWNPKSIKMSWVHHHFPSWNVRSDLVVLPCTSFKGRGGAVRITHLIEGGMPLTQHGTLRCMKVVLQSNKSPIFRLERKKKGNRSERNPAMASLRTPWLFSRNMRSSHSRCYMMLGCQCDSRSRNWQWMLPVLVRYLQHWTCAVCIITFWSVCCVPPLRSTNVEQWGSIVRHGPDIHPDKNRIQRLWRLWSDRTFHGKLAADHYPVLIIVQAKLASIDTDKLTPQQKKKFQVSLIALS